MLWFKWFLPEELNNKYEALTPDHDVVYHLAKTYVHSHRRISKGVRCPWDEFGLLYFEDGLTNGAKWYTVKGKVHIKYCIIRIQCIMCPKFVVLWGDLRISGLTRCHLPNSSFLRLLAFLLFWFWLSQIMILANNLGGMQDYNYVAGCIELTLEISCCKYPQPKKLSMFKKENIQVSWYNENKNDAYE